MMQQREAHRLGVVVSLVLLLISGCPGELDQATPCDLVFEILAHLRVDEVSVLSPVIGGSRFSLRGESFIAGEMCVSPQVTLTCGGQQVTLDNPEVLSPNDIQASLPGNGLDELGGGGSCVLSVRYNQVGGTAAFQAQANLSIELASELTPELVALDQTEVYLNDTIVIEGAGFLDGVDEGVSHVDVEGAFEDEGGSSHPVADVILPVDLVDSNDRTRAIFLWSPLIAGLAPGTFRGTVTPRNVHRGGLITTGTPLSVELLQRETVTFGISPEVVSIGSNVDVSGRGFIGGEWGSVEQGTTSFRLEGWLTPCTGGPGMPLNCTHDPTPVGVSLGGPNVELVGEWISGTTVRFPVTVSNNGGYLHAVSFNVHRGTFEGSIRPVIRLGSELRDGIPLPNVTIVLGPVRQIVWVRFLPGFSTSLDLFGLGAVEAEIRDRVVRRMQEIYRPEGDEDHWLNVEFRTEEPEDFYAGAYAVLDIGGPDPNNTGLFGYDNTPGKDIQNLRLWDHIGGRNALGELDNHGYGGVFVESMLFWSEHPPSQVGDRPRGAPPTSPIFDLIFDEVRENEVVAGEYPNGSDDMRRGQIGRAVSALSNMIADTAAHEFGHSLGLAQPTIHDGSYHNAVPQDGCLMDSGRHRPFEERAMHDGNEGGRFCQENLWYLQDILPME